MNGEIDIIEGVNSQKSNSMALHTAPGCSIDNLGNSTSATNGVAADEQRFSGAVKTHNCDVHAPGQVTNVGCSITASDSTTYGDGFNNERGGVYATQWMAEIIRIFYFSRANIPPDLRSGNPNPSSWGTPLAVFRGCDFGQSIANQSIVFDITFCGDWAGQDAVWKADAICSVKAATCQDYVAENPTAFASSFWEINSLKVYQQQIDESVGSIASTEPQVKTDVTKLPGPSHTRPTGTDRLVSTSSSSSSPDLSAILTRFSYHTAITTGVLPLPNNRGCDYSAVTKRVSRGSRHTLS